MYRSANIVDSLLHLCPTVDPRKDFTVVLDATGKAVITNWQRPDVDQPTQTALEAVDTDALARPVPQTITQKQARLALLGAGLLASVNAAVQAAGGAAQITWEYASVIERFDPLILTLGPTLGLSSAQIDQLFITASTH